VLFVAFQIGLVYDVFIVEEKGFAVIGRVRKICHRRMRAWNKI